MENTHNYRAIDPSVIPLLENLEKLHLIERVEKVEEAAPLNLFDKYLGILTEEEGEDLSAHVKTMRDEWDSI